ncbi:MAG: type II secretion system protein [Minisyncoccia bacterium]
MKKGFTLLELLIVIGILAILSTTMVIVINPAEMLRKARDAQRISDLSTLKTALSYYLTEASSPSIGSTSLWYVYAHPGFSFAGACMGRTATTTASQLINGTGWVPVDLSSLSGGAPISSYPIDPNPVNGKRYYIYLPGSSNTFEFLANMESTTYTSQETTDGGNLSDIYEIGTAMIANSTSGCYTDTGT